MSATDKQKAQEAEQVARVAQISQNIRQALRAALPAPPEQFFTLMIPGKVLDLDKYCQGFDANGVMTGPLLPNSVALEEAMLCDDMPALSGIQLGPTGKSVSRSYGATLSKLCPAGSTTGISDEVSRDNLSSAERRYQHAMQYLVGRDPENPTKTRVDLYREKQTHYTDAVERKTKAFNEALRVATNSEAGVEKQRAAYDKWVSENYKTYNNLVQAAYMDWVTMGKKEEVEYYFAIVDNDSAMSRVEASKESMRAAVISDTDGSAEFQKVKLEPRNWAWLAKRKAASGPKGETVETLTFKISRLQKVNLLLKGMTLKPEWVKPVVNASDPSTQTGGDDAVTQFLQAQKEYQDANAAYNKAAKEKPNEKPNKDDLTAKETALGEKRLALNKYFESLEKNNIGDLSKIAQKTQANLFENECALIKQQLDANDAQIKEYEAQRERLQQGGTPGSKSTVVGLQDDYSDKAGIPRAPAPALPSGEKDFSDFWTSITVEVSSSYSHEASQSSSTSWSVGGSASWGLWSAGASASQSKATSDASKQMSNASVKVSFECMRVDISRPWLRGELFYDHDLRVAANEYISPGPMKLVDLMDPAKQTAMSDAAKLAREKEMERYDLFPMYPTAFLLASNVVLEIEGETADIQQHFSTSNTSASGSVGWGPFAVKSSASRTDTKTDSTCESTASGCRITIKSPQVIGWISQIVPALPRLNAPVV